MLLSSTRQNAARTNYNTSTARTHTFNSQWNQHNKDHCPFGHISYHTTRQHLQHHKKPTHTDQYLHWDSNHHITAKQSVFNTLAHRAKTVSSTQDKMDKNYTTSKQYSNTASSLPGPSISGNTSSTTPTRNNPPPPAPPTTTTPQTTTITKPPYWFPTFPIQQTSSRNCAKEEEYMYILKAQTPLGQL